ncbi:High mobility group B protein 6 [Hibiscus syriacus]|uniref:High mobility group B protein 6 n=1 Tax=Hibiscus syriacus TaxID=106335 RepID=A0A6A3A1B5_HIBSY|nr:high mobility group B protein 6-like [Hibiscus syriacus]KAE8697616.1 High mobility group B protein 6 [Hibiscus syriacus]
MVDLAVVVDVPKKSKKNGRKALKDKNPSTNEANILAQKLSPVPPVPSPMEADDPSKANSGTLTSPKKAKAAAAKSKQSKQSFEKDLQEMQDMLQQLRIQKEKTEELLKEKDEMLKLKEEEIETKGKKQEKLQMELKRLQKMKEFKPTMTFAIPQSLKEKKNGGSEKKRPSPPYILWCKDQWKEIKKENPEADFKEVSNILGAKWKMITAEEKKPYEEIYRAEKEAYLQVMAKEKRETEAMKLLEDENKQKSAMELLEQYLQFKQEAEKETTKKKTKKERDPLKPKQPMSAFFLFSSKRRAALLTEDKSNNILDVAKIAGEEWKNMTEEQRRPYHEMAKKNKEKYMEEMEAYKKRKEEEASSLQKQEEETMKLHKQEALQLLKKEKTDNIIKKTKEKRQKNKPVSDPNKPRKPASSFLLFSKEARKTLMQEREGINNSTLNALISVKWKELGEEERNVWNGKAAEAMEEYKKKLEEYNNKCAEVNKQQ